MATDGPRLVQIAQIREWCATGRARQIREDARLTVREVADELDVHHGTVARWESGERQPSGDLALDYLNVLVQLEEARLSVDDDDIEAALVQIGTRVRRDGMLCPRCMRRYVQPRSKRGLCGWCEDDQDKIERESKRRYARRKAAAGG